MNPFWSGECTMTNTLKKAMIPQNIVRNARILRARSQDWWRNCKRTMKQPKQMAISMDDATSIISNSVLSISMNDKSYYCKYVSNIQNEPGKSKF